MVMMGSFDPWMNQAGIGTILTPGRSRPDVVSKRIVVGATDADGVDADGPAFNEKNLFATIFSALGLDPYADSIPESRPPFSQGRGSCGTHRSISCLSSHA